MGQPGRGHRSSEDADALGQPLHLVVLRWERPTQFPVGGKPRPGQRVLRHKLLPARIVALMRDVPLAHLPLELSEVQPRLVLLGPGANGLVGEGGGARRANNSDSTLSEPPVRGQVPKKVKLHPKPAQSIET